MMTSRDFCFWLQGWLELTRQTEIDTNQTEEIKRHLALVFRHEIDPSMGSAIHQTDLDTIHAGKIYPDTLVFPATASVGEVQTPLGPAKYRC